MDKPLKNIGEQMAALNSLDETTDSYTDRSNSLLNATCPGRIQNTSISNFSFSEDRVARRLKREPVRISPLEQIDENPPRRRSSRSPSRYNSRARDFQHHENYKTRLCDAFRRQGHCPYVDRCQYAHGSEELRVPPRRKTYSRGDSSRCLRDSEDSFGAYGYAEENRRYSSRGQPICRNFERGSCRYGPRCKYLHREQMQAYEPNASIYVASDHSMPQYYHNTCFIPQPIFVPQYVQTDMNQTMPVFPTAPPMTMQGGTTYFLQPMAPTPIMGQPAEPSMQMAMPAEQPAPAPHMDIMYEQFPEFFQRPPPPLGQI